MVYESVRGTKALGLVKEQCVLEVIVVFMLSAVCDLSPKKQHETIEMLFNFIQISILVILLL